MYVLDSATKVLTITASAACDVTVSGFRDSTTPPSFSFQTKVGAGETKTICPAGSAAAPRNIDNISITNTGAANTISVKMDDTGSPDVTTLCTSMVLGTSDKGQFTHADGWETKDSNGDAKFSINNVTGNLTVGGAFAVTGATTLSGALTYGGVTLANAVTGTGNMVLSASPTFTGTVTAGTLNVGTLGSAAHTITLGTSAGTLYTPLIVNAGSGSYAPKMTVETQTGITTSATEILNNIAGVFGLVVWVSGYDGAGAIFVDQLVVSPTTVTVLHSTTVLGAPAARNYTYADAALKLDMASGTYSTRAVGWVVGW